MGRPSIPKSVFSYAHCVREDPVRKGLLYLGTENALYVSFNDGDNWHPLQTNLPHAPVHWLVIQEHFNDLVVATYGRGFWILDDITPLQQLTPEVLNSKAYLFSPRPAYRFRNVDPPCAQPGDPATGENPPYGASIHYYLKYTPKSDVKITILDERGQTIRTLRGTKEPGINRVWWDLRHELPKLPKLRTSPLYAPWVKVGPQGWRPLVSWARMGRIALGAPGMYTVKLTVEGQELSQKLTVKKDPNSTGSEADIRAQVKMSLEIRDNINSVVDMINQFEWIRKQIYDITTLLKGDKDNAPVISAKDELDKKLIAVEKNLFQMKLTGAGQDGLRLPVKLYAKLGRLAGYVGQGDFPPTTQQVEVHEILKKQLATYQNQFNELLSKDIVAFNNLLREKNIQNIIVVKTP